MNIVKALLDKANELLKGEPARAVGYGAAVIIYFVARASGSLEDVTVEEALVQGAAAIAIAASIVETIRRLVYSPATVEALLAEKDGDVGAAD